jgi:hypothetical protein
MAAKKAKGKKAAATPKGRAKKRVEPAELPGEEVDVPAKAEDEKAEDEYVPVQDEAAEEEEEEDQDEAEEDEDGELVWHFEWEGQGFGQGYRTMNP